MNKIDIKTGGHRLHNDDIMFVQAALLEALSGIAAGLGGNSILSGCQLGIDVAGPGWKLQAGFVFLGGELYAVNEVTYPGAISNPVWVLVESAAANNPILYADGNLKDVHMIRKVTVQEFASQPNLGGYSNTVVNYAHNVKDFTLLNDWQNGTVPVISPKYVKEGRWISFIGDIAFGEGAIPVTNLPFATLPPGDRPLYNSFYAAVVGADFTGNYLGGFEMTWIRVDTDGNCYADPNATYGKSINLNNVRFRIA